MGQTHQNMARPNSNSKPKPTLPKGRSTTLIDMMQFVSDWFDFEENENISCDAAGDIVFDCGNSIQEKLVDCFDVVKNVEENVKNEYSISRNFTQLEAEAFDLRVIKEVHIEPTNPAGEGINTIKVQLEEPTIENIVFEDFVLMSHVLVCQIVEIVEQSSLLLLLAMDLAKGF
ncbi:hypothetical protein LWI29_031612 [Acer saccharum]|uniref:Uncharacterized protein n=1 Tax=Acer saccharum TaxID=4024 RepID=A0AA39RP98_ACESA|nr:hypothetical protein LWI29_031612 [Acer saccharum]